MATSSQVKDGLDLIAAQIKNSRDRLKTAKAIVTNERAALDAIPTTYADLITTIDAYTPTGAFETLAKDEKAKLQTEFLSLKAKATGAETDLAAYDFTT